MAIASISVRGEDGGLGYLGPRGFMDWAAFGVASKAATDVDDQDPVVITSPGDAQTLLGRGPLVDHVALALTGTAATVVVFPMPRKAGGAVIGAGTKINSGGVLAVTVDAAVWGNSSDHVILETVTEGAIAAAEFRLIVNGVPYPKWKPGVATKVTVPDASAGPLHDGVAAAGKLQVAIDAGNHVVGEQVEFNYSEPSFDATKIGQVVNRLAAHATPWRFIVPSGYVAPAVWTAFDTAVRALLNDGKYARGLVQLAGSTIATGATADAATAAWNTAQLALSGTPERYPNPRTGAVTNWITVRDPLQNRDRVLPATYALCATMSARQPWQPPDATKHGPMVTDPRTRAKLLDVKDLFPSDFTTAHARSQDTIWLTTLRRYSGRGGIYPTHVRLWGQYPAQGITGSDYIGIERGFVMDEVCTRVYNELFDFQNDDIDTSPNGRMSPAAIAQWTGRAQGGIQSALSDRAITAGEVTVIDKDPGILQTSTVLATLRIVPRGKAVTIEATVGFSSGIVTSEEVAA